MPGVVTQTVLVVDDDPDILRLVVTVLRRLELNVVSANSASEALRVLENLPDPPDLLLTDVVMPGVSGPALAAQVVETNPEVRVLLMSGFEDRLISADNRFPLLSKPFTFDNLCSKVTEVLHGGDTQAA